MSNNIAATAMAGVIALVAGVGIGHFGTLQEGMKTSQDVSAQLAAVEIDSAKVPIAGSPVRGNAQSLATIVVFSDLKSEGLKTFNDGMLNNAFKQHGDKVSFVYKAFPLQENPDALLRAQAVAAAHAQKRAWGMYDAILALDKNAVFTEDEAARIARSLNLNVDQFRNDLNSREIRESVRKDIELGQKLNVTGTPAVFINGRSVAAGGTALTEKKFNDDLNAEIARMSAISSKGNVNYYVGSMLNQSIDDALYAVDAMGRPIRGNKDALVTIVEFSDYECPFCSRVEPTIAKILAEYKDDVRVIFSHNPLPFHKNAKLAHQAAYAAGLQNKFWEMHDILFKNQKRLSENDLMGYAKRLDLDMARFAADLKDPKTVAAIEQYVSEAGKQGISGTPNFLINGFAVTGAQPYEKFKEKIDGALKIARKVNADTGLRGDALHAELLKNLPKKPPQPRPSAPAVPEGKVFVDVSGAPVFGDPNAPVTIVEFTDFQCPYCSRGSNTIKELIEKNPGKVKLVFKSNPLSFHKDAEPAHRAAEAASLQGKFWEMYQLLFDNQRALTQENFDKFAQQIGLNMDKFHADMESEAVKKRVQDDLKQGASVGVRGTPHFFMNGTRMSGAQPLEKFQEALDKELAIAKKYQDKGIAADALYKTIIAEENKNAPKPAAAPAPAAPAEPIVLNQGSSYAKGPADAPVVIYKFSEFECPFCGRVEPTLDEIMKTYEGKVRIVFKNNPLSFHKHAKLASEAALAAGEQGKFWEMHDILFKNQKALERDQLIEHAKTIAGLDIAKFTAALDSHKFAAQVESELAEGAKAGVSGTPTFVINGKKLVGAQPIDKFKAEIDAALAAKK